MWALRTKILLFRPYFAMINHKDAYPYITSIRILISQAYVSLAHKDTCPYALRIRMLRVKQHAFKAVCKQIKLYE